MKNKSYSKLGIHYAVLFFYVFLVLSTTEVFAVRIKNNSTRTLLMRCQNKSSWEKVSMTHGKRCSNPLTPMYVYYGKQNTDQLNAMIAQGKVGSKKPIPTVCSNRVTLYETIILVSPQIPKTKKKPNGYNFPCNVRTDTRIWSGALTNKAKKAWLCSLPSKKWFAVCPDPIK